MHILIISQWYAPEPDGRVSALGESLVKRGHDVSVVTGFPNYPAGKLYEGYAIKWRQREVRNGVRLLRLPLYPDHSRSVIKRSANYLSFWLAVSALAPWLIRKPDVIWAYTALAGPPTIWISKLFRAPFVMEIADIWPDTLTATGMLEEGTLVSALDRLSTFVYSSAAALAVQNPGFKPFLARKGVRPEIIHVVENWADEDIYGPVAYDEDLARANGLHGKFNVMFAGNLGMAQGLDTIVQAADRCSGFPELQWVLIGDGSCLGQVKADIERLGLKNILLLGRKPAREMPRFFAIADALLVHLKDEPIFEITLPSKTQSYLACGRPIIMAKRGDGTELVAGHGCGLSCPPADPEALARTARKMQLMSGEERQRMGEAARKLYLEQFTKAVLSAKMEAVLQEVTGTMGNKP